MQLLAFCFLLSISLLSLGLYILAKRLQQCVSHVNAVTVAVAENRAYLGKLAAKRATAAFSNPMDAKATMDYIRVQPRDGSPEDDEDEQVDNPIGYQVVLVQGGEDKDANQFSKCPFLSAFPTLQPQKGDSDIVVLASRPQAFVTKQTDNSNTNARPSCSSSKRPQSFQSTAAASPPEAREAPEARFFFSSSSLRKPVPKRPFSAPIPAIPTPRTTTQTQAQTQTQTQTQNASSSSPLPATSTTVSSLVENTQSLPASSSLNISTTQDSADAPSSSSSSSFAAPSTSTTTTTTTTTTEIPDSSLPPASSAAAATNSTSTICSSQ